MNAGQQLVIMFDKDVEFLKEEFKKLKDNLKKCLDRLEKATRPGSPYSKLPQCICKYYNQLLFLTEKTANKPTAERNIAIGRNEDESLEVESASLEPTSMSTLEIANPQSLLDDSNFLSQPPVESQTPSTKSKPSPEGFIGHPRKSRAELSQVVDSILAKTLLDMQKKEEAGNADSLHSQDDEDSLYCRTLIPIFKQLSLKKKRLAKVKIDQLPFNIEFNSVDKDAV